MRAEIRTYKQLLAEKARLEALLELQKVQVREDIREIKEELRPVTNVFSSLSMFFSRKAGGIVSTLGVNLLVNGLIKRVLLKKSGWFTRFIVPVLIKNYASHLVKEPAEKLFGKIMNLFSKNGKANHAGMDAMSNQ